jgi:DNA (cytosine-5)-methyltransferase 1
VTLTIGSLFSGIGGLELGLERAGLGPSVFQVERDEYCRAVLAKHWPAALRFDDVCTVGAHNLPRVDVLCGGFPCQDISNAGRRAGITVGTRSGLWFEYSRIIRELRPRYVVVENVTALLTHGLDAVLGELAESGYDAEWDCVPASSVGAPHQRDRIFVVAYPASDRWPISGAWNQRRDADSAGRISVRGESRRGRSDGGTLADSASVGRGSGRAGRPDPSRSRESQQSLCRTESFADSVRAGLEGQRHITVRAEQEQHDARDDSWWSVEPNVGRVAHGIPRRVDRLKSLGNAVVPQVAEVVGRVILERERLLLGVA